MSTYTISPTLLRRSADAYVTGHVLAGDSLPTSPALTLSGSITTDGTTGTDLTLANITAWSWTVTGGTSFGANSSGGSAAAQMLAMTENGSHQFAFVPGEAAIGFFCMGSVTAGVLYQLVAARWTYSQAPFPLYAHYVVTASNVSDNSQVFAYTALAGATPF